MRPGQSTLNEFELALLQRLVAEFPFVKPIIASLHVLSREFTGVGSFTNFRCDNSVTEVRDGQLGIAVQVIIPTLKHGLGATTFFEKGKLEMLETYTYGEDWDGVYDGFQIVEQT